MSRRLLYFLTTINYLNYLDRYLVAALLPVLSKQFDLSAESGGRLVSAFVFGYFLFSPIFGYLGDRYHRPRLMALGVTIWSVACLSCAAVGAFSTFLFFRVLIGVGEASFGTIAPGYIKDHIDEPDKLNRALALFFSAIPAGSALGYVVAGLCNKHWGWQSSFIAGGVAAIVLVPFLLMLPDTRREPVTTISFADGLKELSKMPVLWFAIVGYVFNAFALNGIAAFVSSFGVSIGFELENINFAFGLILVGAGFVGTVVGGNLSARFAARSEDPIPPLFLFIAVSALIAVPLLGGAFLVRDHTLFLILCGLSELMIFTGTAAINAIIVVAAPATLVTLAQGVTIFGLNLFGALLAPVVVGRLADATSFATGLQLCTVALAMSGLVWLAGSRKTVSGGRPVRQ
ncbi:MAG: MFS transporter [Bdellovibrionota bacterium]